MILTITLFIVGLILMVYGADLLVRGASTLAVLIGISPLVVGLTVVAFGTSAPEFAVSFEAAYRDQASICVGNVIGSNIFNILFILGAAALVTPLVVAKQILRFELPLVITVSAIVWWLASDHRFDRTDGLILFVGLVAYTVGQIVVSRRSESKANAHAAKELTAELSLTQDALSGAASDAATQSTPRSLRTLGINAGLMLIGLVMLVLGARWLVDAAVTFARYFQVDELIIGLTIVSIGTSLPEVVTSIIAGMKGERDIAAGNVIGSNLFNLLGVLGLASVVAPSGLEVAADSLRFDLPVMTGVVVLAFPMMASGRLITRFEGAVLLGYYAAYTAYLILNAKQSAYADSVLFSILYIALPVTILWLVLRFLLARRPATA